MESHLTRPESIRMVLQGGCVGTIFFTLGSPEAFVCDSYLDPFECRITPRSQKTVKVVQEL